MAGWNTSDRDWYTLPLVSKLSASFSLQTSQTATRCFQEYSPLGEIHFQSFSFQGNKKAWVFSIGVYWLCGVLGIFNQLNWGLNGRYRSIPLYLADKTFRGMLRLQHQKFGAEIHADRASPSQHSSIRSSAFIVDWGNLDTNIHWALLKSLKAQLVVIL